MTTTGVDADNALTVTEGVTGTGVGTGAFAITLSSAATADVTVTFSHPPTLDVSPGSVTITAGDLMSSRINVTAGHDRNTSSEEATISASATSTDADYRGATGSVPVLSADDDLAMTVTPRSATENTPFATTSASLVTVTVTAPMGGTRNTAGVTVPNNDDVTFYPVTVSGTTITPFDPAAPGSALTAIEQDSVAPLVSRGRAWLVVTDDLLDEDPEMIQVGTTPTGEENRIEPVMISLGDSDPDVTLSIDAVEEGADEVSMTITAMSNGPMPGIFEIPTNRWGLVDEDGVGVATDSTAPTGYVFTVSGPLTIDRNQTEGTVTVTVTAPEDADDEDEMFKVGLNANGRRDAAGRGVGRLGEPGCERHRRRPRGYGRGAGGRERRRLTAGRSDRPPFPGSRERAPRFRGALFRCTSLHTARRGAAARLQRRGRSLRRRSRSPTRCASTSPPTSPIPPAMR